MTRDSVTLRDVAEAAGVSVATASRALTGKSRVSKATVAHVVRVAERLGYQVNVFGRALREGAGRTVGVLVPELSNPFFGELLRGIEEALQHHGLEMLIADSHESVDRERSRLEMLVERRVEGVIAVPSHTRESVRAFEAISRRVPLVQLDRTADVAAVDFVGVDNERGIALLVDHLLACGVRDVVMVASDETTSAGQERLSAVEKMAAQRGLSVQDPILQDFSREFGVRAASTLLARGPLPDAVLAGDDLIATGVITALKREGVRIPADVLITGFDGTLLADVSDPTLTTVEQPFAAIAREAVRLLLRRSVESAAPVLAVRLPPELRVGDSTGTAAGA